jgi:hypothetical protein
VGILVGAAIGSFLALSAPADIALEYVLGFGFGWTIFQALFMRDMAGGSYAKSLRITFLAEFLSMNVLMTAMLPVAALGHRAIGVPLGPAMPAFWFVMSIALFAGLVAAYPMNWWLVSRGLKHGMTTVRPGAPRAMNMAKPDAHGAPRPGRAAIAGMSLLSVALLATGVFATLRLDSGMGP